MAKQILSPLPGTFYRRPAPDQLDGDADPLAAGADGVGDELADDELDVVADRERDGGAQLVAECGDDERAGLGGGERVPGELAFDRRHQSSRPYPSLRV